MPLARLFAFYAAIAARYGSESAGPTFVQREMIAARRKAQAAYTAAAAVTALSAGTGKGAR